MRQTVLCYNLKGTKKGRKLGMIFSYLGFKVRHILPEEYHIPVGELAEGERRNGRRRAIYRRDAYLMSGIGSVPRQSTIYDAQRKSAGAVKSSSHTF